jgi:hypothetical protein
MMWFLFRVNNRLRVAGVALGVKRRRKMLKRYGALNTFVREI